MNYEKIIHKKYRHPKIFFYSDFRNIKDFLSKIFQIFNAMSSPKWSSSQYKSYQMEWSSYKVIIWNSPCAKVMTTGMKRSGYFRLLKRRFSLFYSIYFILSLSKLNLTVSVIKLLLDKVWSQSSSSCNTFSNQYWFSVAAVEDGVGDCAGIEARNWNTLRSWVVPYFAHFGFFTKVDS